MLELSKQDKGGRATDQPSSLPAGGGGSSTNPFHNHNAAQSQAQSQPSFAPQPFRAQPAADSYETQPVLDLNSATRVRAIYAFASNEIGELNFERGDIIKVLDRGFKEWWRGACNGKIGVGPLIATKWELKVDLPRDVCRGYGGAYSEGIAGGGTGRSQDFRFAR